MQREQFGNRMRCSLSRGKLRAMDYAEFAPVPELAPYVRCVWTFTSAAASSSPERIVPDGRCELIVHAGEPYYEVDSRGRGHQQPRALFAGQVTRPLHLLAKAQAAVIGVRFHPAGARAFLGRSLRDVTDVRASLDQLWLGAGSALSRDVLATKSVATRMAHLQKFVISRIEMDGDQRDPMVEACVARIDAAPSELDIPAMAADAGLGRRQLERRFSEVVGVGPALLASILRFRRVFDALERDASAPWTEAALLAGYFDQSHFIREFRRFVGCSPTQFVEAARGLASALAQPQGDVAIVQAERDPAR
jgi:AraC-like DNA-binding protein